MCLLLPDECVLPIGWCKLWMGSCVARQCCGETNEGLRATSASPRRLALAIQICITIRPTKTSA